MGALPAFQSAMNNPMPFGPFKLPAPNFVPDLLEKAVASNPSASRIGSAAPQAAQGVGANARLSQGPPGGPGFRLLT
jgi:hypothetical protein